LQPSGEPAIPSAPVCAAALGDAASDAAGAWVSSRAVANHNAVGMDDTVAPVAAARSIVTRDKAGLGGDEVMSCGCRQSSCFKVQAAPNSCGHPHGQPGVLLVHLSRQPESFLPVSQINHTT